MSGYKENVQLSQDKVKETFELFHKTGQVIYPENERIYYNLSERINSHKHVLEAGCGIGLGSAIMYFSNNNIIATDKKRKTVAFASRLYPWLNFDIWDVSIEPYKTKADIVIAIEVIEHIKDYQTAFNNLLASTLKELWISTPNRLNKNIGQDNPANDYHVKEFTPQEIIEFAGDKYNVEIFDWSTFRLLPINTDITPLIYQITEKED